MLVAMLMLSPFQCSCFFSEDFLRIVLASPSLGFAPIQKVLWDNGIQEDVLWIVSALPSLGFCSGPRRSPGKRLLF